MCIKFCGAFELALRGHDETSSSENPGIYQGLINFASELDSALALHLIDAKVFKSTSKTIQNDLLDAMFEVYRNELINQIKSAKFIAIEADETTDISNQQQMVVIIRYVFNGEIFEMFWAFVKPEGYAVDILANCLMDQLKLILNSLADNSKLIAQSYDGAAVMSGKNNGVQAIIKNIFPQAHFVHEYLENIIDQPGMDSKTISEASGLLKFLDYPEFMHKLEELRAPKCKPQLINLSNKLFKSGKALMIWSVTKMKYILPSNHV
ncbi:uncharacterized protein LOC115885854 [Sitophilus oryzae]|uniref:Uncharacterized protein LOC115885854 n=1 Tax=Sitophilus oryzae TaxID=7048 RepID=A0A6J2YA39_SITOR|nr:uncharacterized protein LOC115885854 [Sitophilus oryzae]